MGKRYQVLVHMKLKSKLKFGFVQPLTWITLGILAGTGMSSLLMPQPTLANALDRFLFSPELRACTQRQGDRKFDNSEKGRYCEELEEEQRRREEEHTQKREIAQQQQDEKSRLKLEAQSLYDQGKFASAETIFRKLIKMYPDDVGAHYQLGNVLYRQDKLQDAISEYQQVLKLSPKYAVAHNAVGVIQARLGNWEQAIAEYKQAISINPEYADALHNLGLALLQQGNSTEAIAPLEKAKNLFKQQMRFEEVRQINKLLQEISQKKIEA